MFRKNTPAKLASAWWGLIAATITVVELTMPVDANESKIILSFEYGPYQSELGLISSSEDALDLGPSALAVDAETLYILDPIKSRIVAAPINGAPPKYVEYDHTIDAADLIVVGGAVIVRDRLRENALALQSSGAKEIDRNNFPLKETSGSRGFERAIRSIFRGQGDDLPSTTIPVGKEFDAIGDADVSGKLLGDDQAIIGHDGKIYYARFNPADLDLKGISEYRGELVFAAESGTNRPVAIPIRRKTAVKSAHLMAVLPDSSVLVEIHEIAQVVSAKVGVQRKILAYERSGKVRAIYLLPKNHAQHQFQRSVAVERSSGRIFALVPRPKGLDVLEISPIDPNSTNGNEIGPTPEKSDSGPVPRTIVDAKEIAPVESGWTRFQALVEAQRYATALWQVTQNTHHPPGCDPKTGDFLAAPKKASRVGQRVVGIPYSWAGGDSVEEAIEALSNGSRLAGNVCARRNCPECSQPGATVGVDCSGLISNLWRLNRKISTRDLQNYGTPITSITELLPGDVFNWAGRHVIMFAGTVPTMFGEMVMIYESSLSCGGVCLRAIPWGKLTNYTMYRNPNF